MTQREAKCFAFPTVEASSSDSMSKWTQMKPMLNQSNCNNSDQINPREDNLDQGSPMRSFHVLAPLCSQGMWSQPVGSTTDLCLGFREGEWHNIACCNVRGVSLSFKNESSLKQKEKRKKLLSSCASYSTPEPFLSFPTTRGFYSCFRFKCMTLYYSRQNPSSRSLLFANKGRFN